MNRELRAAFKREVEHELLKDGFSAKGLRFARENDLVSQVLSVQISNDAERFVINLGVQPKFGSDSQGSGVSFDKFDHSIYVFTRRLFGAGQNEWYFSGRTSVSIDTSVRIARLAYVESGRAILNCLFGMNSPLCNLQPQELSDMGRVLFGFGSTDVQAALCFSKLRLHEGRFADAIGFAEYGISKAKGSPGIRSELQSIIDLARSR